MSIGYVAENHVALASEAPAHAFLGNLVKIQIAGEQTGGVYSLTEHTAPAGFGPPMHIHHNEDEGIYVLQGKLQVWCGDSTYTASAGDFTFLPREVAHTWKVSDEGEARLLIVASPPGFEQFIEESGERSATRQLPQDPPTHEEIGRMMEVAPRYGIEFVGGPGE